MKVKVPGRHLHLLDIVLYEPDSRWLSIIGLDALMQLPVCVMLLTYSGSLESGGHGAEIDSQKAVCVA